MKKKLRDSVCVCVCTDGKSDCKKNRNKWQERGKNNSPNNSSINNLG